MSCHVKSLKCRKCSIYWSLFQKFLSETFSSIYLLYYSWVLWLVASRKGSLIKIIYLCFVCLPERTNCYLSFAKLDSPSIFAAAYFVGLLFCRTIISREVEVVDYVRGENSLCNVHFSILFFNCRHRKRRAWRARKQERKWNFWLFSAEDLLGNSFPKDSFIPSN